MTTVTIEEAQAKLPQLIEQRHPGEEMTITAHRQPLAQVKKSGRTSWPFVPGMAAVSRPGPGLCKGAIRFMSPDFDAPLEDMKEYME